VIRDFLHSTDPKSALVPNLSNGHGGGALVLGVKRMGRELLSLVLK
jgi:hypothetical protein